MEKLLKFTFLFCITTAYEIFRKKIYPTVNFRYICSDVKFLALLYGINIRCLILFSKKCNQILLKY